MLAMARNQPGQNGGNQGPIFSVDIAALSTHEMEDPSNALASSNRDRLMHALYPANSQLSVTGDFTQNSVVGEIGIYRQSECSVVKNCEKKLWSVASKACPPRPRRSDTFVEGRH